MCRASSRRVALGTTMHPMLWGQWKLSEQQWREACKRWRTSCSCVHTRQESMTTAPRLGLRATRLWPTDWLLGRVIIHQMLCPWWGASCTWPSHRQSTRRSPPPYTATSPRSAPIAEFLSLGSGWSWRSPSERTCAAARPWQRRSTPCGLKSPCTGSTTTWARSWCRTCWFSALPTTSSPPGGTETRLQTSRSPSRKILAPKGGEATLTSMASSAMSCRTIWPRCWHCWPWSPLCHCTLMMCATRK
mmetsp:Transcript_13862/g.37070  ORF Transcript_13862/g.37070 Transcript_13862/m.37070 type:complete len:246 (-) Transcript_13862:1488-2225(-)